MNERLVACLILAILAGSAAAVWTAMTGWGWLGALAAYSLTGSLSLVAAAVVAASNAPRPAAIVPRAAPKEPAFA